MTRRDYVKMAEGLNRMAILLDKRPKDKTTDARKVIFVRTVYEIANVLTEDNERFDRSKFIKAVYQGLDI